jgi:hypothetical protein
MPGASIEDRTRLAADLDRPGPMFMVQAKRRFKPWQDFLLAPNGIVLLGYELCSTIKAAAFFWLSHLCFSCRISAAI